LMSIVSLVIAPHIAVDREVGEKVGYPVFEELPINRTSMFGEGRVLDFEGGGIEEAIIKFIESDESEASKENWFNFNNLNFVTGSANIDANTMKEVANISQILRVFPTMKVKVGGYTDNTGDAAANLKLSTERAASVKAALVGLGVDQSRVESEGYGEQHPEASNETEEGRIQNRRIAISVREK
jgi:K(+)-stimulated pyrophosphate-energized sodium pump